MTKEPEMSHDDFQDERFRVERVLDILEHSAQRLEQRAYIPATVLRDAVAVLRATEDAAYDAAQSSEEEPPLTACIEQHIAARKPLTGMEEALAALERGEAAATASFVKHARAYIDLRREHLRLDDRLFGSARHATEERGNSTVAESVESAATLRRYDRLIEASAIIDIGAPTAFPINRSRRFGVG
jgi:hemerythrin-like domain-containing protein